MLLRVRRDAYLLIFIFQYFIQNDPPAGPPPRAPGPRLGPAHSLLLHLQVGRLPGC